MTKKPIGPVDKPKSVVIRVRLDPATKADLDRAAEEDQRSISQLVLMAIRAAMKKRKG